VEAATEFVERMERIRKEAEAALERAARDMKTFYDRRHQEAPAFQPGDEVLLEGENLRTNRPAKKLDHRRFGPFRVERKVGERAYRLKLPTTWKIHPVFHVSKLLPYRRNDTTTSTPPPPDIVNGEPQQEIEDILGQRVRRGKPQYLVKWRGFPMEENEWKNERDLENAQELLNDFKSRSNFLRRPRKRGGVMSGNR